MTFLWYTIKIDVVIIIFVLWQKLVIYDRHLQLLRPPCGKIIRSRRVLSASVITVLSMSLYLSCHVAVFLSWGKVDFDFPFAFRSWMTRSFNVHLRQTQSRVLSVDVNWKSIRLQSDRLFSRSLSQTLTCWHTRHNVINTVVSVTFKYHQDYQNIFEVFLLSLMSFFFSESTSSVDCKDDAHCTVVVVELLVASTDNIANFLYRALVLNKYRSLSLFSERMSLFQTLWNFDIFRYDIFHTTVSSIGFLFFLLILSY